MDPFAKLTSRERELLVHMRRGLRAKEIARIDGVHHNTVNKQRLIIAEKLGLKGLSQVAVINRINAMEQDALKAATVQLHRAVNTVIANSGKNIDTWWDDLVAARAQVAPLVP